MQFTEKMRYEVELDNEERVFLLDALHGWVEAAEKDPDEYVSSTDQLIFVKRLLGYIDIDGAYHGQG